MSRLCDLMLELCKSCEYKGEYLICGGCRIEGWIIRCLKFEVDGYSSRVLRVRLKSGWSRWKGWRWFERIVDLNLF